MRSISFQEFVHLLIYKHYLFIYLFIYTKFLKHWLI